MYVSADSARVTATIDVRGDTDMHCLVNEADGEVEVRLGGEVSAIST